MKVAQALRSLAANLIFKKKVTLDQSKTIPLNTPNKLDAKSFQRHFPAATKE